VPTLCLPSRPNLEHLKGQARTLQRQIRAAFDRLLEPHRATDGSLEIPVSVKLASGVKHRSS